ncbi:MFS transporter [Streptomyces iakyrus]|uniref:hypothetical protein n=1 Tax=Streptomyces iakyrus TaxID=68219 RepID=UPI00383B570F
MLLVTVGTGALIYGLVEAGDSGWTDPATLLALAGAVVVYATFAAVERVSRAPLMDLRMFTRRPVLAGAFLMLIATALLIAFFFLGSVYLQHVRGFSPLRTGLVFLPVAVATGVGAHLGSRLVGRIGSRTTAVGGMVIAAAGTIPLTQLPGVPFVQGRSGPGLRRASGRLATRSRTAVASEGQSNARGAFTGKLPRVGSGRRGVAVGCSAVGGARRHGCTWLGFGG